MGAALPCHAFPLGGYQTVESRYDIQYKRFGRDVATGSGSTAEVRACTDTKTHALRAVKTIEKVDWKTRGYVMEEVQMLREVSGKHPNIIEFIEFFEEWGHLNLIFEYCPKGTLETLIESTKLPLSDSNVATYIKQLLAAVGFLASKCILHRDVKPANLLLANESTVKLADFGVACFCMEPLRLSEGTPAFFPPEVHQLPRGNGYSLPMDVWAAGITMYMALFVGGHPFHDRGNVSKGKLRIADFDVGWLTSSKARDLLEWMMMPCPDQRISACDALDHPWFAAHGLGPGTFEKERPYKLVLDSHGNWLKSV